MKYSKSNWNRIVFLFSKYYFIGTIIYTLVIATQGLGFAVNFFLIQLVALISISLFLVYSDIDIKALLVKVFFLYSIISLTIPIALPLWIDIPAYLFFNRYVEETVIIDTINVGFGFTSAYIKDQRHMFLDFEDKYPTDELITIIYLPFSKVIVDAK